jgi:ribosome recycling factor
MSLCVHYCLYKRNFCTVILLPNQKQCITVHNKRKMQLIHKCVMEATIGLTDFTRIINVRLPLRRPDCPFKRAHLETSA